MGDSILQATRPKRSRHLLTAGVVALVLLLGVVGALSWVAHQAEPMLRVRVTKTLSARFRRPVELDELHLSLLHGLAVEGRGLRILNAVEATRPAGPGTAPLMSIRSFQFRTGLQQLFEPTMHVAAITVEGAELHIPPREERASIFADHERRSGEPHEDMLVDRLIFTDLRIILDTRKAARAPLEFDVANLILSGFGLARPFDFDATLRNPKPVGDIRAVGHFGPWQNDRPRDTPLDGSYVFSHADLATIKGLGGVLSSNGQFGGTLNEIVVDGVTDTPDFHLSTSGHALPLHTSFHARVDALTGDTFLEPVRARLAHSDITATGSVTKQRGVAGHDVELNIVIERGRLDDLLTLGVRTSPPVVRGSLVSHARLSIPPGTGTVARRMRLQGSFDIEQATFTNAHLQQQIDEVSERALNWAEKANPQQAAQVTSSMKGSFHLEEEQMNMPEMVFSLPGATVHLEGLYGLDGATMDFHGTVRTQATASEMVGGWRGLLVMPFDRYLTKGGVGMEVPFRLSGTQKDPKLALDFDHRTASAGVRRK